MLPKFNPSLCHDEATDKLRRVVLRNVSFNLRDIMLDREFKKIVNLIPGETNLRKTLKENSTIDKFNAFLEFVEQKFKQQSREIRMSPTREI